MRPIRRLSRRANAASAPEFAQPEHDRREHGDGERAVRERAGGGPERVAERVADQREAARPDERAEQAPRQERPQAHARGAGEERCDRADEADEAPDEDRLGAVAAEELLDALEPRGADAEARAPALHERAAEAAAEREAREIAARGGGPRDQDHQRQADLALRGD